MNIEDAKTFERLQNELTNVLKHIADVLDFDGSNSITEIDVCDDVIFFITSYSCCGEYDCVSHQIPTKYLEMSDEDILKDVNESRIKARKEKEEKVRKEKEENDRQREKDERALLRKLIVKFPDELLNVGK